LAVKAGKPVILVEASPADIVFFRKLGKRLVSSAASPEEAIDLIMKQMERSRRWPQPAEHDAYNELSI
ncbi:MAG TPA: hypothetical protein VD738_05575, partial [Nitrospira sp.]|nr:hypothetical protein [Nitrospira sp.]